MMAKFLRKYPYLLIFNEKHWTGHYLVRSREDYVKILQAMFNERRNHSYYSGYSDENGLVFKELSPIPEDADQDTVTALEVLNADKKSNNRRYKDFKIDQEAFNEAVKGDLYAVVEFMESRRNHQYEEFTIEEFVNLKELL